MRRVLIVSPYFPPINGADAHRVRMSLPYFRAHGYEPLVLALDPSEMAAWQDDQLSATVPDDVRVWRTRGAPERVTRAIGLRNAALRGFPQLARLGGEVIAAERVDLVYFSTTAFPLMTLGRYWQARFGVPYVLDLQDPWFSDYYEKPGAPVPPGGRFRYGTVNAVAQFLEPFALRRAAHIVSVSAAYPDVLMERYAWLRQDRFTVLPFGAPEHDFDVLDASAVSQRAFDPTDGYEHWVYVGRGGGDMAFALRALFAAIQRARAEQPERFRRLRLHFLGTDYATGDRARKTVEPIAHACGVADLVEERPHRIPYFEGLKCLRDADALIVPGSDDPGYTASKLYPYILARKPLLAVFHERSSVVDVLAATRAGEVVTFRDGDTVDNVARRVADRWFTAPRPPGSSTNWAAFEPYTAREMTRKQCRIFDRCLDRRLPEVMT